MSIRKSLLPNAPRPDVGSPAIGKYALDLAFERIVEIPVKIQDLYNPDLCPEEFLGLLAWSFSVDEWNQNWDVGTKRQAIRESFEVHSIKGSVTSIKKILEKWGDAEVIEGVTAIICNGEYLCDGSILCDGGEIIVQLCNGVLGDSIIPLLCDGSVQCTGFVISNIWAFYTVRLGSFDIGSAPSIEAGEYNVLIGSLKKTAPVSRHLRFLFYQFQIEEVVQVLEELWEGYYSSAGTRDGLWEYPVELLPLCDGSILNDGSIRCGAMMRDRTALSRGRFFFSNNNDLADGSFLCDGTHYCGVGLVELN